MLRLDDLEDIVDMEAKRTRLRKRVVTLQNDERMIKEREREARQSYVDAHREARVLIKEVSTSSVTEEYMAKILDEQRILLLTHHQLMSDIEGVYWMIYAERGIAEKDLKILAEQLDAAWDVFIYGT